MKKLLALFLIGSLAVQAETIIAPVIVNSLTIGGTAATPTGTNTAAIATVGYVQSFATSSVAGVATFNGRAGAVTQTSADVTNALGYTPAQSGVVAIGSGGTGATTAAAARTALGLGTAATQASTAFDPAGAAAAITTITGNAGTATALAANPVDCTAGQFANAIAANGDLTCATPASGGVTITGTPTVGQVPTATSGTAATWKTVAGGSSTPALGNLLVNSGAMVKQRVAAPPITTAYQIGQVANMAVKVSAGAPTTGTITQVTNSLAGSTGYAMRVSGVSVATASTIVGAMRMESLDAVKYKNKTVSLSVSVAQYTGVSNTCTPILKKAGVVDYWVTETTIAIGLVTVVPTATGTLVKMENVAIGDTTNGLSIEISCDNAAGIVTKDFDFTEFQIVEATTAPTYLPKDFVSEDARARRYAEIWEANVAGYLGFGFGNAAAATTSFHLVPFKTSKRIRPTGIIISSVSHFSATNGGGVSLPCTLVSYTPATSKDVLGVYTTVPAGLTLGQGSIMSIVPLGGGWLMVTGAELF